VRAIIVLAVMFSTQFASAESWNIDLGFRGAGTIAVGDTPMSRSGAVPSLTVRAQRSFGTIFVGANLAAGFPVYVGQHEASLSIGVARVVRDRHCVEDRCDARLTVLGGVDAGITILHYDAPPDLPASSDALLYWGPLARARAAFRATWPTPSGKEIGITVGAGLAAVSARYMSTASGDGLRVEPELDVAGVVGF
jgi:hypothetical protein